MVGTKPTRRPSRFEPATRARRTSSEVMVSIIEDSFMRERHPGANAPGESRSRLEAAPTGSGIRMLLAREAALAHRVGIGADRAGNAAAFGEKILDELRPAMAAVQAEQVVQLQQLAIAARAGADAEGRDQAGCGDHGSKLLR